MMTAYFVRLLILAGAVWLSIAVARAESPRATITFDNQSGDPAVVKLIGPTGRVADVPNGQKRAVKVVGGQYYIVTRYGADPDRYTYSKGDPFHVTQTSRQYSVITITLHKVVNGNYQTHEVSADEFDRSKP
jgi:hypothetical protein